MRADIPFSTHQDILDEACGSHSCGDLIARTRLFQSIQALPSHDLIEQDHRSDEISLRLLTHGHVSLLSGSLGMKIEPTQSQARASDERILFNYQLEHGRHLRDAWAIQQKHFSVLGRDLCQDLARAGAAAALELRLTDYRYFNSFGAICRRFETEILLSGTCLVRTPDDVDCLSFQKRLDALDSQPLIELLDRKNFQLRPLSTPGKTLGIAFHPDILELLIHPVLLACSGDHPQAIGTALLHRQLSLLLKSAGPESFDDEGYPVHDHELIDRGQLVANFHNSVTARQQGWKNASTGHAYRRLQGSLRTDFGCAEIVALKRSLPPPTYLYVREIKTHHRFINQATGDFSFVASIEVHTPQGPLYRLQDRLITGNSFRLWQKASAAPGTTLTSFSGKLRIPPLYFDDALLFNP